ncbi:hypothetical protein [Nesterenkonia massiliensis]|uniref:hypothetical protein n=1 Tax=Nesterenkonia massiliensis TaxID=1232429 RepID=UPI000429E27C|nr:hypothetical protein [Nesterenkonia massiliensis]
MADGEGDADGERVGAGLVCTGLEVAGLDGVGLVVAGADGVGLSVVVPTGAGLGAEGAADAGTPAPMSKVAVRANVVAAALRARAASVVFMRSPVSDAERDDA